MATQRPAGLVGHRTRRVIRWPYRLMRSSVTRSVTGNSRDRRPSKGPTAPSLLRKFQSAMDTRGNPYDRRRVPGWDPNSLWPVGQATPRPDAETAADGAWRWLAAGNDESCVYQELHPY
jgi:hypothetical protein